MTTCCLPDGSHRQDRYSSEDGTYTADGVEDAVVAPAERQDGRRDRGCDGEG